MYLCNNQEHCKLQLHTLAITYWYSVAKYTFYKAKITSILIPFKLKIKKSRLKGKITTCRHRIYISTLKAAQWYRTLPNVNHMHTTMSMWRSLSCKSVTCRVLPVLKRIKPTLGSDSSQKCWASIFTEVCTRNLHCSSISQRNVINTKKINCNHLTSQLCDTRF
jgi:hypothetical protein